jgi:hypothetical protein
MVGEHPKESVKFWHAPGHKVFDPHIHSLNMFHKFSRIELWEHVQANPGINSKNNGFLWKKPFESIESWGSHDPCCAVVYGT